MIRGCRAAKFPLLARSFVTGAATVVNPVKPISQYINEINGRANSLVVATTPDLAPELLDYLDKYPVKSTGTVVGLVSDAIPFGAQRHAMSILALDSRINILDAVALEPSSQPGTKSKTGRSNWDLSSSFFSMALVNKTGNVVHDITLSTANTLFSTGSQSTLMFKDETQHSDLSGTLLSALRISVPGSWAESADQCVALQPLVGYEEPLIVTGAADNMLKTINGRPAASFLENSSILMNPEGDPHDRKVFVEITSASTAEVSKYEVIAGGGGTWSPRSSMLVVEPPAVLHKGDQLKFSLSTAIKTVDQFQASPHPEHIEQIQATTQTHISLECASIAESFEEQELFRYPENSVLHHRFGLSSEHGFILDDKKHAVYGESATFTLLE